MSQGNLFIISAPSGTGKTTILKRIFTAVTGVVFSVSHTTRPPRAGEKDAVDYFFTSRETFTAMEQQGLFLEWAEVHGNLYGTSSEMIQAAADKGLDIILDIDVQGARQVRRRWKEKSILVFIAPPSLAELAGRLAGRSTETEDIIARRLTNAKEEMKSMDKYDYVIINDTVDRAVDILKSIIIAERSRTRRGLLGEPLNLVF